MLQSDGSFCVCGEDGQVPTEVMVAQEGQAVEILLGVGFKNKGDMYSVGYFWEGSFYLKSIPTNIAEKLGLKIDKHGFMEIKYYGK